MHARFAAGYEEDEGEGEVVWEAGGGAMDGYGSGFALSSTGASAGQSRSGEVGLGGSGRRSPYPGNNSGGGRGGGAAHPPLEEAWRREVQKEVKRRVKKAVREEAQAAAAHAAAAAAAATPPLPPGGGYAGGYAGLGGCGYGGAAAGGGCGSGGGCGGGGCCGGGGGGRGVNGLDRAQGALTSLHAALHPLLAHAETVIAQCRSERVRAPGVMRAGTHLGDKVLAHSELLTEALMDELVGEAALERQAVERSGRLACEAAGSAAQAGGLLADMLEQLREMEEKRGRMEVAVTDAMASAAPTTLPTHPLRSPAAAPAAAVPAATAGGGQATESSAAPGVVPAAPETAAETAAETVAETVAETAAAAAGLGEEVATATRPSFEARVAAAVAAEAAKGEGAEGGADECECEGDQGAQGGGGGGNGANGFTGLDAEDVKRVLKGRESYDRYRIQDRSPLQCRCPQCPPRTWSQRPQCLQRPAAPLSAQARNAGIMTRRTNEPTNQPTN
jgi:hypothetical protein